MRIRLIFQASPYFNLIWLYLEKSHTSQQFYLYHSFGFRIKARQNFLRYFGTILNLALVILCSLIDSSKYNEKTDIARVEFGYVFRVHKFKVNCVRIPKL